ncbi:hypothetical protein [Coleofasciculus sp.]|uniref:hypothetical protein n=1 Tax=Coleofasciculus sp. TaxID=3100458 RepID=UPI003A2769FB
MKLVDGLSYRDWQKRNTEAFSKLDCSQGKKLRSKGYRNIGWDNVQKSWSLLQSSFQELSLFEHKLRKGDLTGAINHSILEAEQAQEIASEALESITENYNNVKEIADQALAKYQLL